MDRVVEGGEALDGEENDRIEAQTHGCEIRQRPATFVSDSTRREKTGEASRQRIHSHSLEKDLDEDETARLDSDSESLQWSNPSAPDAPKEVRSAHLNQETDELEINLSVRGDGDSERDHRNEGKALA